jgi:HK97 family phage prohead protease
MIIGGYCCTWNVVTANAMKARPHCVAFDPKRCIPLLVGHDPAQLLDVSTSRGNLAFRGDRRGLSFRATLPPRMASIASAVRRGELAAASVLWSAGRKSYVEMIDGEEIETVQHAQIEEVSLCDRGADPGATVWVDVPGIEEDVPYARAQLIAAWRATWAANDLSRHFVCDGRVLVACRDPSLTEFQKPIPFGAWV